jgi:hypothetical protein
MKVKTFQFTHDKGWSIDSFPPFDSPNTLILVFAAAEYKDNIAPIKELIQHYPQSKLIGCSSAGEIAGSFILDHSLSVAIVEFEKTSFEVTKTEIKKAEDSFKAGEQISRTLNKNDLAGIFILSPGLNVNGSELVKGLNTLEKKSVVITGGLAADGKRFEQTWVIHNGEILKDSAVAIGFYGESLRIGHASRGGWDIFGPERRITNSKNNILYELDERPALELYKEYLGERANGLPATGLLFPLAIRSHKEDSRQLVRTILGIDEKEQSLIFAGDVPTGYLAQLMRANFDRLVSSASEAGEIAIKEMLNGDRYNQGPVLALAISCVGRRLLLGERTEEETESMLEILPPNTEQVGFYSYGELSPYARGSCDLHNQTMTLTTFYEN